MIDASARALIIISIIIDSVIRSFYISVLLDWRMILGWTSHGLERLRSLNFLLQDGVLSLLCIFDPLFDVDLQVLF